MTDAMNGRESQAFILGGIASDLSSRLVIGHVPRSPGRLDRPIQVLDPLPGSPGGHCAVSVARILEQSYPSCFQDGLEEVRASGVVLLVFVDTHVADLELSGESRVDVQRFLDV